MVSDTLPYSSLLTVSDQLCRQKVSIPHVREIIVSYRHPCTNHQQFGALYTRKEGVYSRGARERVKVCLNICIITPGHQCLSVPPPLLYGEWTLFETPSSHRIIARIALVSHCDIINIAASLLLYAPLLPSVISRLKRSMQIVFTAGLSAQPTVLSEVNPLPDSGNHFHNLSANTTVIFR